MKKFPTVALGVSLAVASASAAAADATGAFVVSADAGQAQYHIGRTNGAGYKIDDKDTTASVRLGYVWRAADHFHVGVEAGYTNLGTMKEDLAYGQVKHADVNAKGWLLGANGKYHVAANWYLQARAGWFRSKTEIENELFDQFSQTASHTSGHGKGNGWYGGLGIGYDLSPNFSLGLNYINYHAKAKFGYSTYKANIGAYTVGAEYRF